MGIEFVDNEMLKKIAECKNKPLHECPELFRVLAANCKCDTIKDLYDLCEKKIEKKNNLIREINNKLKENA